MGIFKFKEKGPAYGLGHTEGELVEIDEEKGLEAVATVAEVAKNGKGELVPTGRQVAQAKNYSVEYLIENGVIVPATKEEKKQFEAGQDINSQADKRAEKTAREEAAKDQARADKITGKVPKAKPGKE